MKKIILVAIAVLAGCSNHESTDLSEFDSVCNAFIALSEHKNLPMLTAQERDAFISKEIEMLDPKGDARVGWEVVRNAVVEERYDLYRNIINTGEEELWSCPAMQQLAKTIEINYTTKELGNKKAPEPVTLKNAKF